MRNKQSEELQDSIRFVLPLAMKNEFFRLCREDARSPSLVLRRAVLDFIAANSSGQAAQSRTSRKQSAPVSER